MVIISLYTLFLIIAWAAPSTLTLSRYTYGFTSAAHFVTFLVSVVLFVLMGRSLRKRHRRRFIPGLFVGAFVGAIGTGIAEFIRHLPPAQRAFVAHVPLVPRSAALTMLTIHAIPSAILAAAIFAVLFGTLGAIATWWGGLKRSSPTDTDHPDPHPVKNG